MNRKKMGYLKKKKVLEYPVGDVSHNITGLLDFSQELGKICPKEFELVLILSCFLLRKFEE